MALSSNNPFGNFSGSWDDAAKQMAGMQKLMDDAMNQLAAQNLQQQAFRTTYINPNQTIPSSPNQMIWTCEACGTDHPDPDITVSTFRYKDPVDGFEVDRNFKHCKHNVQCIATAREKLDEFRQQQEDATKQKIIRRKRSKPDPTTGWYLSSGTS